VARPFFKNCLREEVLMGSLRFEAATLEGTDHDSVAESWNGGLEKVLATAKESLSPSS